MKTKPRFRATYKQRRKWLVDQPAQRVVGKLVWIFNINGRLSELLEAAERNRRQESRRIIDSVKAGELAAPLLEREGGK